jgi:nucleoside-diphosphate-sugar epimerase
MEKKYLVTGGGGFIGSHIVEELLKRGESVRVLDDFSTGRRENLSGFKGDVELIEGDIRDKDMIKRAMAGIKIVFHQAAVPSVPRSIREPDYTHDVNVNGTFRLLLAARDEGVDRFVFASSSSVYGDTPKLPKVEDMPTSPLSPYAVQKLMGEYYTRIFYGVYGLPTVCLRYFNIFGPRQDPNSEYSAVIPRFIKRMIDKSSPIIYGDGTQSRDFTHVSNAVNANLLATMGDRCLGDVMNISTGERIDVNTLAGDLGDIMDFDMEPIHEPERAGDVKHSLGDITKAKRLLGYEVITDFREGLSATVDFYLD